MRGLLVVLVPLALVTTGGAAGGPTARPADQEPSVVAAVSPARTRTEVPGPQRAPEPAPVRPTTFHLWTFHAPVVPLELSGSELVPPPDPSVLGWWGRPAGARAGTTLMTGHTVHTGGGVLDDLEHTPVGSTARVSRVEYEVASVRVISKSELARRAPRLFAQDGAPKLVVVTCEGYDPGTGRYADNVVVVARPKEGGSRNPE